MISHRKRFTRFAERVAILGAVFCLSCAAYAAMQREPSEGIALLIYPAFAILLFCAGVGAALASEFASSTRQPGDTRQENDGLSPNDIAAVIGWAPALHKIAAVAGILLAIATGLVCGSVEWSGTEPATQRDVAGAMLYHAAMFLLVLPVLASASRMPGSYEQNAHVLRQGGA